MLQSKDRSRESSPVAGTSPYTSLIPGQETKVPQATSAARKERETHFRAKKTHRLKERGGENGTHDNKAGVVIFISDTTKAIKKMIEGSTQGEGITPISMRPIHTNTQTC